MSVHQHSQEKEIAMQRITFIAMLLLPMWHLTGCVTEDEDRCSGKLVWSKEQGSCIPPSNENQNGDADKNTPDDTAKQAGLGDPCRIDDDCADAGDYDFCLLDPTNPEADGMCSMLGCTAEDCSGDFVCCDCTQAPLDMLKAWTAPVCVDPGSAALLKTMCTCQ
jgi:hypothetical protein